MPFQFKKISDVGTANPIVARLSLQWFDLFRYVEVSRSTRDEVLETMLKKVQPRVLECDRIAAELTAEIEAAKRKGVTAQIGSRAIEVPSVMRLQERAEDFLYDGKLAVRDFGGVFRPLFGNAAPVGNFLRIAEWATKTFGGDDPLSRLLAAPLSGWMQRVREMRDAVEHPTTAKAPLTIQDFAVDLTHPTAPVLLEPMWWLNREHPVMIAPDVKALTRQMFFFFEEALIASMEHLPKQAPVIFEEVLESARDPAAPVRYRVNLGLGR